jgi:hypothetical protein
MSFSYIIIETLAGVTAFIQVSTLGLPLDGDPKSAGLNDKDETVRKSEPVLSRWAKGVSFAIECIHVLMSVSCFIIVILVEKLKEGGGTLPTGIPRVFFRLWITTGTALWVRLLFSERITQWRCSHYEKMRGSICSGAILKTLLTAGIFAPPQLIHKLKTNLVKIRKFLQIKITLKRQVR